MRIKSFFATLAALALMVTSANTAHGQWPTTTQGACPDHSIEFGGKFYDRPGTESSDPVFIDSETNETLFDAEDATDIGSAPGVELSYRFKTPRGRQMQLRGFLADWDDNTFLDAPNLAAPTFTTPVPGLPGSANIGTSNYLYTSRLISLELNTFHATCPGFQFFAGPRFVHLDDKVEVESTNPFVIDPTLPTITGTGVDLRSFNTDNNLIGGQIGLQGDFQLTQWIRSSNYIRAGGYSNFTRSRFTNTTTLLNTTTELTDAVRTESDRSTGAFLGEVGTRLYVDVIPGCVACYGGYEATWIDGIALAPAQFGNATGGVDTKNTLFMQAIMVGVSYYF